MSISFDICLQRMYKDVVPFPKYCEINNKDAAEICYRLVRAMKKCNAVFKQSFDCFSLNGSYRDRLKIKLPDEFDFYIKLKLPFHVKPQEDVERAGFVILTTPDGTIHPLVRQNRVSRQCLQTWIRGMLEKIISIGLIMGIEWRTYEVKYPEYGRGYGPAHTICAKGLMTGKHGILFDLVSVFEFSPNEWPFEEQFNFKTDSSWYAVPFGKTLPRNGERLNEFDFMACVPQWERNVLHDKHNLQSSLRLVKALRNANNLNLLSGYLLKKMYIQEIGVRPELYWEQPVSVILIEMLEVLLNALINDCLPLSFDCEVTHQNLLHKELLEKYPEELRKILKNIGLLQRRSRVNYDVVSRLFIDWK